MQKLHSHKVSRLSSLVLALFKAKKKQNTTDKNNTKTKKQNHTPPYKKTHTQFSETPQGGAGASETPDFSSFFLSYRKPSTLLIWKYSAPSSKTYMLNSESISETFHLQAALRDTVVTGSSRKKSRTLEGRSTNRKNVFTHI